MNMTMNQTANMTAGPAGADGVGVNSSIAYLPGRAGGQILNGGTGTNENLTLNATVNGVGNVLINPNGGFVGINTLTPGYSLDTTGDINVVKNAYYRAGGAALMTHTGNAFSGTMGLGSTNPINLQLNSGSSNRFYIQASTGNIGINTDSPVAIGAKVVGIDIRSLITGSDAGGGILFGQAAYQNGTVYTYGKNMWIQTNAGDIFLYPSVGNNVTIGLASSTAQLDTSGTVRFRNFGAGTATFDANGMLSSVSDEKYKTNIVPFTRGLAAILSTNPINYKFNAASGLDTQYTYTGFSAQQLRMVIPESVFEKQDVTYKIVDNKTVETKTGTTTLSISDRAIIAALVNSVKELSAKNDALEKRITVLEEKVGK
jgi:hypothetical protein